MQSPSTPTLGSVLAEACAAGIELPWPLPRTTLLLAPTALAGPVAALATGSLAPRLAAEDRRVIAPAGDRWRAGELSTALVESLTHRPSGPAALVTLTTLEVADPSSLDRLLVLAESSPASFRFLFAASTESSLPPQLLGRVAHRIRADQVQEDHIHADRIAAGTGSVAERLGIDPAILTAALPFLLGSPAILASAEKDLSVLDQLAELAALPLVSPTPSRTASALIAGLRKLADPGALRQGVELLLHTAGSEIRERLPTRGRTALAALEGVEQARAAWHAGADPVVALTAALWAAAPLAVS